MELIEINVADVKPSPHQPRKEFNEEELKELAESISENGLINPINVTKTDEGYELVSGERRLKAHKIAGLKKIKAIVRELSEEENITHALIENIQRVDLIDYEKGVYVRKLYDKGYNREKISKVLGKSVRYVRDLLDLTDKKCEHIAQAVKEKKISLRAFSDIKIIKNKEIENKLVEKISNQNLTLRELREYSQIARKSPKDVTKALMKDEINLKQANAISKITNSKVREKMIKTHKSIKTIDNGIEKSILTEVNKGKENKLKVIQIKEQLEQLRKNTIENERATQLVMKNILKCKSLINLMDEKQASKFKYYHKLYQSTLNNALALSETITEQV